MQDRGWTDAGLPPPFSARYVSDDLDAASSSWAMPYACSESTGVILGLVRRATWPNSFYQPFNYCISTRWFKNNWILGHQIWYTQWSWGTLVWDWFWVQKVSKVKVITAWEYQECISMPIASLHLLRFTRWRDDEHAFWYFLYSGAIYLRIAYTLNIAVDLEVAVSVSAFLTESTTAHWDSNQHVVLLT